MQGYILFMLMMSVLSYMLKLKKTLKFLLIAMFLVIIFQHQIRDFFIQIGFL